VLPGLEWEVSPWLLSSRLPNPFDFEIAFRTNSQAK
jgi:hypothetical protein